MEAGRLVAWVYLGQERSGRLTGQEQDGRYEVETIGGLMLVEPENIRYI